MLSHMTYDVSINLLDKKARHPAVSRMAQRNTGRNAEGGREDGRNEINTTIKPSGNATIHAPSQRGWVGVAGGVGWERGDGEDNGNDVEGIAKEKDATRSFVSYSPEKEVEEPWHLPLL